MGAKDDKNRRLAVRRSVGKWRSTEAELLSQMGELLPYPASVRASLNKSSILRLTKAYLHLQQLQAQSDVKDAWQNAEILVDMFGGFLLTLDTSGLIIHVSTHVLNILGFHAHDMIGLNILEFVHPDDTELILDRIKLPNTKTELGLPVEFAVKFRYKTLVRDKKTKHTGFLVFQVRGIIKCVGEVKGNDSCIFIGACYCPNIVPCITLASFQESFIIKFNVNRVIMDEPDNSRVAKFLELEPAMLRRKKDKVGIAKDHIPYVLTLDRLLFTRGTVENICKLATKSGFLIQFFSRFTGVYGAKGEVQFIVVHHFAISKEKLDTELCFPGNSLIRVCPEYIGVPGESGFRTGAIMDMHLKMSDLMSLPVCPNPPFTYRPKSLSSRNLDSVHSPPSPINIHEVEVVSVPSSSQSEELTVSSDSCHQNPLQNHSHSLNAESLIHIQGNLQTNLQNCFEPRQMMLLDQALSTDIDTGYDSNLLSDKGIVRPGTLENDDMLSLSSILQQGHNMSYTTPTSVCETNNEYNNAVLSNQQTQDLTLYTDSNEGSGNCSNMYLVDDLDTIITEGTLMEIDDHIPAEIPIELLLNTPQYVPVQGAMTVSMEDISMTFDDDSVDESKEESNVDLVGTCQFDILEENSQTSQLGYCLPSNLGQFQPVTETEAGGLTLPSALADFVTCPDYSMTHGGVNSEDQRTLRDLLLDQS